MPTFVNVGTGRLGSLQEWTVPYTGPYRIVAKGARGGYAFLYQTSTINPGGNGAIIQGEFNLTAGHVIRMMVGQMGGDNPRSDRGGAGGGGTFVYNVTTGTLLMAAGGGGGAGQYSGGTLLHASTSTTGNAGTSGGSATSSLNNGGAGPNGGSVSGSYGGGGGGYSGNGVSSSYGAGGLSYTNGGTGGLGYNDSDSTTIQNYNGGYGGGGGSYAGGGGGGGYGGGGNGSWSYSGNGGGGGSYNTGTSQVNTVGNTTHGSVDITILNLPPTVTITQPASDAKIDPRVENRIEWTYSDVESSPQTQYEIDRRKGFGDTAETFAPTSVAGRSGTIQTWVVPTTGVYRLTARGASGAWNTNGLPDPGKGAVLSGDFSLTAGQTIKILVGQMGDLSYNSTAAGMGGGGGTFVYNQTTGTLLLAAGGGGGPGGSTTATYKGCDASLTTSPNNNNGAVSNGFSTPAVGNGGNDGYYGGGGAGWNSSGQGQHSTQGYRMLDATNPGIGGYGYSNSVTTYAGGFGGGGGGSSSGDTAGGGGGYTGGNGGSTTDYPGGGGGSYNAGANPAASLGNIKEAGLVTIEPSWNTLTPVSQPAYPVRVLAHSPARYLRLDEESGSVADAEAGPDATYASGTVGAGTSPVPGSKTPDGGYVTMSMPTLPRRLTMLVWFKADPGDLDDFTTYRSLWGVGGNNWDARFDSRTHITFHSYAADGSWNSCAQLDAPAAMDDGAWHMLALVWNGDTGKTRTLLDGVFRNETTFVAGQDPRAFAPGTNFTVGAAGGGRVWTGQYAEWALVPEALTDPQVAALFAAVDDFGQIAHYHDIPANTFDDEADYTIRVRAHDGTSWGPYSTVSFRADSWTLGPEVTSSTEAGFLPVESGAPLAEQREWQVRTSDGLDWSPWSTETPQFIVVNRVSATSSDNAPAADTLTHYNSQHYFPTASDSAPVADSASVRITRPRSAEVLVQGWKPRPGRGLVAPLVQPVFSDRVSQPVTDSVTYVVKPLFDGRTTDDAFATDTVTHRRTTYASGSETRTTTDGATRKVIAARAAAEDISHYSTRIRNAGPVANWRLDEAEGSTARDEMGVASGTHVGSVQRGTTPALLGGKSATYPDGSSHTRIPVRIGPRGSLALWVETGNWSDSNSHGIFQSQDNASVNYAGWLSLFRHSSSATGPFYYRVVNDAGALIDTASLWSTWFAASGWHHIVATWGDGRTDLYINGQRVGGRTDLGAYSGDVSAPGANSRIGFGHLNGANGTPIDDVAYFDRPLTLSEVQDLHRQGVAKVGVSDVVSRTVIHARKIGDNLSGDYAAEVLSRTPVDYRRLGEGANPFADSSGHDNSDGIGSGTYTPGFAGAIVGDDDKAVSFASGTIDLGNPPNLQVTEDQSVVLWLRPNDFAARRNPWDKAYGGEGTITQEPSGALNYYWGTGGTNGGSYQGFTLTGTLTLGQWNMAVLVRDLTAGKLRWYLNGTKVTEGTASGYGRATRSPNVRRLGSGYAGVYNGGIDEVAEYAGVLTDADVLRLYQQGMGQIAGTSDIATRWADRGRAASDAAPTSDSASGRVLALRRSADAAPAPDSPWSRAIHPRTVGDAAPAVDDGRRAPATKARSAPDTLSISDAAVRSAGVFRRTPVDSAPANPAGTRSLTYRWFTTNGSNPTTQTGFDALFAGTPAGEGEHLTEVNWSQVGIRPSYLPATAFAWEVSGHIFAPETGTYTFQTQSDDGNELAIDGAVVTAYYNGRGVNAGEQGSIHLTTGYHEFRYRMQQGGGGAGAIVSWKPPSAAAMSVIPTTAFSRLPRATAAQNATRSRSSRDDASRGTNLMPGFHDWQVTGGAYVDPDTGDLVFTAHGQEAHSPTVWVGDVPAFYWSADYFADEGESAYWPGSAGLHQSSIYLDADGQPTTNTWNYTGNGNAQEYPLGAWTRKGWTLASGNLVRQGRMIVRSSATYTPPGFRMRNPQIITSPATYDLQPALDGVADAVVRTSIHPRTPADSASASDAVTHQTLIRRTTGDAAPASDAARRYSWRARQAADSVTVTDAARRFSLRPRTASDMTPASDSASRKITTPRTGSDTAAATDTASRYASRSRTGSDGAPVTEKAVRSVEVSRLSAELLHIAQTDLRRTLVGPVVRPVFSEARPLDVATFNVIVGRSGVESVPATDSAAGRAFLWRQTTDSAPVSDQSVRGPAVKARTAADARTTSDLTQRFVARSRTAPDLTATSDGVLRSGTFKRGQEELAVTPQRTARVVIVSRTNDSGVLHMILPSLGYTDVTIDTTITTIEQLVDYDIVVEDSYAWSLAKSGLLKQAYDAGYAVLTTANDTNASQLPFALSSQGQAGFNLTPADGQHYAAQGWTKPPANEGDSGVIITAVRGSAIVVATHPTSSPSPIGVGYTAIAERNPNGSGGQWFHIQPSSNWMSGQTQAKVMIQRATDWLATSTQDFDLATRQGTYPRASADVTPVIDAVGSSAHHPRASTDTVTSTDAATRATLHPRTVGDDAPSTDDGERAPALKSRPVTETITTSDAAVRSAGIFRRVPGDLAPATDTATRYAARSRSGTDGVTGADTPTHRATHLRTPAEVLALADAPTHQTLLRRTATDAAPAADSAVRQPALKVRSTADTTPVSDGPHRAILTRRTGTEWLHRTQEPKVYRTLVSRVIQPVFSEARPIDLAERTILSLRSSADTLLTTDAPTQNTDRVRTATDAAPARDAETSHSHGRRVGYDAAPATDGATRQTSQPRAGADTAPVFTDAAERWSFRRRTATASAPSIDSATRRTVYLRSPGDTAPAITDVALRVQTSIRSGIETLPLPTDGPTRKTLHPRTIGDSAPITDDGKRAPAFKARPITEVLPTLSDAAVRSAGIFRRTGSDAAPASDVQEFIYNGSAAMNTVGIYPNPAYDPARITLTRRTDLDAPGINTGIEVSMIGDGPAGWGFFFQFLTRSMPKGTKGYAEFLVRGVSGGYTALGPQIYNGPATERVWAGTSVPITSTWQRHRIAFTAERDLVEGVHFLRFPIGNSGVAQTIQATDVRLFYGAEQTGYRNRITADSVKGIDALTHLARHLRSLAESLPAVTDNLVHDTRLYRAMVESAPATDVAIRRLFFARANFDVATGEDSATRTTLQPRQTSDTAPASDSVASPTLHRRATTDAAAVSDAASRFASRKRTTTDASPTADLVTRSQQLVRQVTDAAPATGAAVRSSLRDRTASDALTTTDAVLRSVGYRRGTSDSSPASDTANRYASRRRTAADARITSDAATRWASRPRTAQDTLTTVTDAARRVFTGTRRPIDLAAALDAATRRANRTRTGLDAAPATAVAIRSLGAFERVVGDDAPMVDDGLRKPIFFARNGAETITTTDAAVRLAGRFSRTPVETAGAGDVAGRRVFKAQTLTDQVPVVTDSGIREVDYRRVPTDLAPAIDTATRSAVTARVIHDGAEVTDGARRTGVFARSLAEELATDDSATRYLPFRRTGVESAPATDAPTHQTSLFRTTQDAASGEDTSRRFHLLLRRADDAAPATDSFAVRRYVPVLLRTPEDLAPALDSATSPVFKKRWGHNFGLETRDSATATTWQVRFAPTATITSVSASKVSLDYDYDDSVVTFSFDQPVIEWIVRVNSTSHLDGVLVDRWADLETTQYGLVVVPAWRLRHGDNRVTVYGKSVQGVWSR